MNLRQSVLVSPKLVKIGAAVVIGLSIGTLVPPTPVLIPAIGAVPGLLVGGFGLVVGVVLYRLVPRWVTPSECGCSGDCGCS